MFTVLARWTIRAGKEQEALAALTQLAASVQAEEGTLTYLIHVPDMMEESLPTPSPQGVLFLEVYKDRQAFSDHVNGPIFKKFLKEHMDLFLSTTTMCPEGHEVVAPFVAVEFLQRVAGFVEKRFDEPEIRTR